MRQAVVSAVMANMRLSASAGTAGRDDTQHRWAGAAHEAHCCQPMHPAAELPC
jgi:hypothetical protein